MVSGQPGQPGQPAQAPSQGEGAIKEATAGIMQQLDAISKFAQTLEQSGQADAAKAGMQGVEMIKGMLSAIGVGGGQPQAQPQEALGAQNPDTAGSSGAVPVGQVG